MNHVFITHECSYKASHNGLEILSTQFGEKRFPGLLMLDLSCLENGSREAS